MENSRKTCVLPHGNYKVPCQQRHWHCNHKIARLPNLIAFEIWWSSTRCLSPDREFATNPSFKPIFLVLNNSPLAIPGLSWTILDYPELLGYWIPILTTIFMSFILSKSFIKHITPENTKASLSHCQSFPKDFHLKILSRNLLNSSN